MFFFFFLLNKLKPINISYSGVFYGTGAGAADYIIEHAEIDFLFVQDKKVKLVRM